MINDDYDVILHSRHRNRRGIFKNLSHVVPFSQVNKVAAVDPGIKFYMQQGSKVPRVFPRLVASLLPCCITQYYALDTAPTPGQKAH